MQHSLSMYMYASVDNMSDCKSAQFLTMYAPHRPVHLTDVKMHGRECNQTDDDTDN